MNSVLRNNKYAHTLNSALFGGQVRTVEINGKHYTEKRHKMNSLGMPKSLYKQHPTSASESDASPSENRKSVSSRPSQSKKSSQSQLKFKIGKILGGGALSPVI
jgi:hypothetical protein